MKEKRMMKEKIEESFIYKSFVIQTWPMSHIVCGGGGIKMVFR